MSWSDFYRRRDALESVLRRASRDPQGPLPLVDGFDRPEDLLLALHHKWTQRLTGAIGVALAEAHHDPMIDRVDAVSTAWRRTARDNRTLRALLDRHVGEHADALRPAVDTERRLVALAAGLVEAHEPADEIARVGAAFLALLAAGPHEAASRWPMRRLRRGLPARV